MRLLLLSPFLVLGIAFSGGGAFLFQQEQWSRAPEEIDITRCPSFQHPEATLGVVRNAFASNNFSSAVLSHVFRSVEQVPSFYQPAFLLAEYHGARIEEPVKTRRAYEAAVTRFPANGRLHLSYSQWLLESRLRFPGFPPQGSPEEIFHEAVHQLKQALQIEPELTRAGLELLQKHHIPPEQWTDLVPDGLAERRQLFQALARAGHRPQALSLLREMLQQNPESDLFREAAGWALQWGDPALAIESARKWQEKASGRSLPAFSEATLQLAKAHLGQDEMEAAYQVFRDGLKEIEARSSASSPSALELLCGMGNEYLRRNQTVMAESLFAEAGSLAPHHTPALLGLARTHSRAGDRNAAIEQYQKVLQLEPENAQAENELAPLILERELATKPP